MSERQASPKFSRDECLRGRDAEHCAIDPGRGYPNAQAVTRRSSPIGPKSFQSFPCLLRRRRQAVRERGATNRETRALKERPMFSIRKLKHTNY